MIFGRPNVTDSSKTIDILTKFHMQLYTIVIIEPSHVIYKNDAFDK